MKISIQDELGRIDLNHADASLLIGLFKSVGLDVQSASKLADKILDWRDVTPSKRLNGAKEQDYRMSGHAYRPRNGAFQSVHELKVVMDMTTDLFRRVEPALTLYSERPFIDPRLAPAEALLALPSMDAAKVAALVAARAGPPSGSPIPAGSPEMSSQQTGRAFTIRIEFERRNGVLIREAVIRLTDNPTAPYWVLSWTSK